MANTNDLAMPLRLTIKGICALYLSIAVLNGMVLIIS